MNRTAVLELTVNDTVMRFRHRDQQHHQQSTLRWSQNRIEEQKTRIVNEQTTYPTRVMYLSFYISACACVSIWICICRVSLFCTVLLYYVVVISQVNKSASTTVPVMASSSALLHHPSLSLYYALCPLLSRERAAESEKSMAL
jgi:hypothetical protein